MIKTNIKKILAILTIATLAINTTYAATQIGTWSVTWAPAFNSTVMWNDVIPWFATGSVSGIIVKWSVLPTLNMIISTGAINLGTLSASAYATWSLSIEVGTNAANWVIVSAKSGTGWLKSISNGSVINNLTADWLAESYRFSSALGAVSDSVISGYSQAAALNTEVSDTTTSHTIYTTTKPEASDWVNDVTFSVSAKVDQQTPAGTDYQDTVIITVVWKF